MPTTKRRIPTFTAMVNVATEVDIEPSELEEAGWRYVGSSPAQDQAALAIVRNWHDEVHAEAWRWCREQPCRDLNRD